MSSVQDVTVGFAQQQLQAPYFAAMQVRAEQIAQEQGFTLLFQSANKDPVIQMNQMQSMLSQGIDVLVVNATSVKGQAEMMTQIASKVPVIYIDTSAPELDDQRCNLTTSRSAENPAKLPPTIPGCRARTASRWSSYPATDEFVGPTWRQGFLDGLKEGGLQFDILAGATR